MAKGQSKRGKLRMRIKKWNMFDIKGGVFFLEKIFNFKAASVTIYPNGFFDKFSVRGAARARSCIFKAGDEERLHIFVLRLAGCWLSGHCRFLAGGGRQDRQSPGGRLLE